VSRRNCAWHAASTQPGPTAAITPRRRCRVQSRYPTYPIQLDAAAAAMTPPTPCQIGGGGSLRPSPPALTLPSCDNPRSLAGLWYLPVPQCHQLSLSLSPPPLPQSRNRCSQLPHCLWLSPKPTTRGICTLHPPPAAPLTFPSRPCHAMPCFADPFFSVSPCCCPTPLRRLPACACAPSLPLSCSCFSVLQKKFVHVLLASPVLSYPRPTKSMAVDTVIESPRHGLQRIGL
jgi:hypothetical protein